MDLVARFSFALLRTGNLQEKEGVGPGNVLRSSLQTEGTISLVEGLPRPVPYPDV